MEGEGIDFLAMSLKMQGRKREVRRSLSNIGWVLYSRGNKEKIGKNKKGDVPGLSRRHHWMKREADRKTMQIDSLLDPYRILGTQDRRGGKIV